MFKNAFANLQKVGKSLMLPVSVLPIAGILLGVGSANFSWLPAVVSHVMAEAGGSVFANMPLIFAIGVALGFTNNDGVYQDELVTAFRDISPQAPTHILIIPNKLIPTINDVTTEDEAALGRMIVVASKIAQQEGIAEDGYRLIVNCNRHGGQEVYHIHMHLLGGRSLGPMLARA